MTPSQIFEAETNDMLLMIPALSQRGIAKAWNGAEL